MSMLFVHFPNSYFVKWASIPRKRDTFLLFSTKNDTN